MKNQTFLTVFVLVLFAVMANGFASSNTQGFNNSKIDTKAMIDALQDENNGIRYSAVEYLRNNLHTNDNHQNHEDVTQALTNTLRNDKEYQIRIVAAITLMDHGDERTFKIIENQAQIEKNKTVKKVLNGIVAKMKSEKMFAKN